MPAEWEPQKATWLAWPHNEDDWPDRFGPIPWAYVEFIRTIAAAQKVRLVVKNQTQKDEATSLCGRAGIDLDRVDMHIIPTDRVWLRDSGPTFVYESSPLPAIPLKGEGKKSPLPSGRGLGEGSRSSAHRKHSNKIMLDWKFNAWAKYPNHKKDDKIPAEIESLYKWDRIQPMHKGKRVVLEGGAIDVNGKGTLLTTEECLLSKVQCRNPGFAREDYETVFAQYLGISQIIWLGDGIVGDDTHGHVDDLARFVNPTTIVTVVERDKRDGNYELLQDNLKRLKKARDAKGKAFDILPLPMPRSIIFEGQRLPASYANFLICNEVVLVPTFNDPADRVALNILRDAFPKREVIGLYSGDFIWGLGTLHCASQQEIL